MQQQMKPDFGDGNGTMDARVVIARLKELKLELEKPLSYPQTWIGYQPEIQNLLEQVSKLYMGLPPMNKSVCDQCQRPFDDDEK